MSPSATATPSPRLSTFRVPDLFSRCQFTLILHQNCDAINDASAVWYENACTDLSDERRRALKGLKSGVLAASVYHDADDEHLRVVCDFINYIFLLDDLSDELLTKDTEALKKVVANALEHPHSYRRILPDGSELPEQEPDASKLARDFWSRCILDARPGFQSRFIQSTLDYMKAVREQAQARDSDVIPSLSAYIEARRDNSGVYPLIDALEYTLRIDLPDYVMEHPILMALKQCSNDFVSWSNDIFSFNAEQARDDWYNMVAVFMKHHGLDIQGAIDRTAEMCCQAIDTFHENKAKLPSWGPEIDRDVSRYVCGLESWISGSLYWSFATERYFGPEVLDIKQNRVVKLLPPKRPATNAA